MFENKEILQIGKNVVIKLGAVLGGNGFGYEKIDSRWVYREHKFGVIIEDDVHIGSNSVIDRGRWRDTVIGEGTKIDNLCHIGHNAKIGKHCLLVAGCIIGGSSTIGDYSELMMGVKITSGINVGEHCLIGANSFVNKDIPDHSVVFGSPAKVVRKNV